MPAARHTETVLSRESALLPVCLRSHRWDVMVLVVIKTNVKTQW